MKENHGFTMVELIAVIVIVGLLSTIGALVVSKIVKNNKIDSFYVEVSNTVDDIKKNTVLDNNEYCVYDSKYAKDSNYSLTDRIMVIMHMEDGNQIASVYASMKNDDTYIDVYDFKKSNINDKSKLKYDVDSDESYTYYATSLLTDEDGKSSELLKFKQCSTGGEDSE